jgi:hypothetical protein
MSGSALSQSRKASAKNQKPVAKKTEKSSKDAKKEKQTARSKDPRKDKTTAKAKDSKKDKQTAKTKDSKKDKLTAKDRSRDKQDSRKDAKSKSESRAEARKAAAERRRAEEERRQAILAEQRRREQAAREARARQLAFERGLHNETTENIANDNPDGEDLQVRRAAVNALGSHAGTVVVMEAQTGKIVTIVNQQWAIRNGFKPCSTIKLVTGVAGLSEHVIDNEGNINGSNFRMQLQDALAFSNNAYFQRVGSDLGGSKMVSYARSLGLGEPTGINAEGETAGRVPNGNNSARIYSHGDDFEVTPLQLAVLVSAISNGGKRVVPQIPKASFESTNFRGRVRQQVSLPQQDLRGVLPGMIGAAEYGTARRGVDASLGIAGKTGSCIAKGSWVGLFASVAPVENPKYSVVVITRGQGERGKYAAAVAGKIYQALAPRLGQNPNRDVATAPFRTKSNVDSRTAAKIADEDDDDSDSPEEQPIVVGQSETRVANVRTEQRAVPNQPVKPLVKRTVNSKAVFAPVVITYKKDNDGNFTKPAAKEPTRPRVVKNK